MEKVEPNIDHVRYETSDALEGNGPSIDTHSRVEVAFVFSITAARTV